MSAAATHSDAGAAHGSQDDAGKALVAERCIRCHDLTIVTARHAAAEEWREIINRMIMNGAQLSDTEAEAVIGYLATSQGPQWAVGESLAEVRRAER